MKREIKMLVMAFLIFLLNSGNIKGEMELRAFPTQKTNCNERTVLQCNISSSVPLNIDQIYWTKHGENEFKCDPKSSKSPPGYECSYTREALTLTILHSTPAQMGQYFCCVMADSSHGFKEINVSVEHCTGDFSYEMPGPQQLKCSFTGLYPEGTIHWFQHDRNVTSIATLSILKNPDGTFNITSVIDQQDDHDRYMCSLWSLKQGRYLKKQEFKVPVDAQKARLNRISSQHCFSWTLLLLGLLFVSIRSISQLNSY
ncbi:uncharacterized protein LOC130221746 [Danio aesculapii]|uniref:uncharacterized protein LOC130221746 n=1 Tax=Danio aesculapii TaxID=1142201 RepID=UPI0024C06D56|nr:uncharacterized protein LOC130221746 [Danio aesculapii]